MSRNTALWALAAVCGLVLAAGMSWATSQLTGQHIGLSSEPISAGRSLAPGTAAGRSRAKTVAPSHQRSQTSSTKSPSPATQPPTTGSGTQGSTSTESVQPAEPGARTTPAGATESGGSHDEGGSSGSSRPSAGRDD